jgi:hypothetical protein
VSELSLVMQYFAGTIIVFACTVACSGTAATALVPSSGLQLITDSNSYHLNNPFGRSVDVWVKNGSDTTVKLAGCASALQGFREVLRDGVWSEGRFYCDPTVQCPNGETCNGHVQAIPLAPGARLRASARFQTLGIYRFRIPIYQGVSSYLSAETSNAFEIR